MHTKARQLILNPKHGSMEGQVHKIYIRKLNNNAKMLLLKGLRKKLAKPNCVHI